MLMSSYMIKVIFTTGLKEIGALGMAASLKTNRIGFKEIQRLKPNDRSC